jgi:uncharacterized membrane protein
MLLSIKLWALAHLLVRGDLASVVLFGSFLTYAIFDRISVGQRMAIGPLGTAQGGLKGDILVILLGLGAYFGMLSWGHGALIGVKLLPG